MNKLVEFVERFTNLKKAGGICSTKGKLAELQDKLKYLKTTTFSDDFFWLAKTEKHLLGIALSANHCNLTNDPRIENVCADFHKARPNQSLTIGVEINQCNEYITRSGASEGKKRCDLTVADASGNLRVKVWSEVYEVSSNSLVENNCVIIRGEKGYGRYGDFLIAKEIWQL